MNKSHHKAREKSLTIDLPGFAARQTLYYMAHRYAMLSTHVRLTEPEGTAHAPWASIADATGGSLSDAYCHWIMEVDKSWVDFRKAMESIFGSGNVPAVPFIQWNPYRTAAGKLMPCLYDRRKVFKVASEYAQQIVQTVLGEERK